MTWKNVKDIIRLLSLLITGLTIVLLIRTATFGPPAKNIEPCETSDADRISVKGGPLERFKQALRIKTISWDQDEQNDDELQEFVDFVTQAFPLVHSTPHIITRELVSNFSMLYTVKGTDPSLQSYLLIGHFDVVPVAADKWDYDGFGAIEEDGYIYARGTIDNKHQVMGILEALEYMLKNGIQPKRSFYVAFGHDEEIVGYKGAKMMGKMLKDRGERLAFVHDEGMGILDGIIPGAQSPIA